MSRRNIALIIGALALAALILHRTGDPGDPLRGPARHAPEGGETRPLADPPATEGREHSSGTLVVSPRRLAVVGTVRDEAGAPLPGAVVRCLECSLWAGRERVLVETRTGEDGTFVLSPIHDRVTVAASSGGRGRMRLRAGPGDVLDIMLDHPAVLLGTVRNERNLPVAEALVRLFGEDGRLEEARTSSSGEFALRSLLPGEYRPVVTARQLEPRVGGESITVEAGATVRRDFVLARGWTLKGRVTATDTGLPIPDAVVTHATGPEFGRVESNARGEFILRGQGRLGSGFVITADGFLPGVLEIPRPAREKTAAADISLGRGGIVSGIVVDAHGTPIANALVGAPMLNVVHHPLRCVETGPDGLFRLAVPLGPRCIFARAYGYALSWSDPIHARRDREWSGVTIRLEVGGGVEGTVTTTAGAPIAGARLEVRARRPLETCEFLPPVEARTSRDGTFRFHHVPPGLHDMRVSADGFDPAPHREVDVRSGGVVEAVEITLSPQP